MINNIEFHKILQKDNSINFIYSHFLMNNIKFKEYNSNDKIIKITYSKNDPIIIKSLESTEVKNTIIKAIKELTNENVEDFLINYYLEASEDEVILEENGVYNNLNPEFTFQNYAISNENELAVTAGKMIAEIPGNIYNPLYVFSQSGLGKTHLINAIGHEFLKKHKNGKVLYLLGQSLIEDFTNSLSNKNLMNNLKYKLTNVDILIIDDINLLTNAKGTQDLLYEIFEILINSNKQIILTSDKSPKNLKGFEDRLKNRFSQGTSCVIDRFSNEMKFKVVSNICYIRDIDISDEIRWYIANNIGTNGKDLGGALNRLTLFEINNNIIDSNYKKLSEISIEEIKVLLKDLLNDTNLDPDYLLDLVSNYYDITKEDLLSKSRKKDIKNARNVAIYLIKKYTNKNINNISIIFNKDHTTILHSLKKINEDIKADENINGDILKIESYINYSDGEVF